MLFLFVLVASYAALWPFTRTTLTVRERSRIALALGMAVAGVSHLANPMPFVQHLPTWVPERYLIVFVSGLIEIAFGAALLAPVRLRPLVGAVLAAYLMAVFPGNDYVAVAGVDVVGQPGGIYAWLRLPFQSAVVDESPEHVWELYADVPGTIGWVPFVEEVLYVRGPAGVGQTYRERTRF